MKMLLGLMALLPTLAFAGPLILDVTVEKGSIAKISLPIEAVFEATSSSSACRDRFTNPMPSTPQKVKKVAVKILSKRGKVLSLSIPTALANPEACNYQFKKVSIVHDNFYTISVEALDKNNSKLYDVKKVEISANQNSFYSTVCKDMNCSLNRDNVSTGRSFSNTAVLLLDLRNASRSPELRAKISAKFLD